MSHYIQAGEQIVPGNYAVVRNAEAKGWTWWLVVVFPKKEDVWDELKSTIKKGPKDDNHVIVFYVGSWGVTKESHYEIVNIERIWHEDSISYAKMLQHIKEDSMKRDLAEAIYNREVNREEDEATKDMEAVKRVYELFKMKYQDPAEKRAALLHPQQPSEDTRASRADARRKRSTKPGSSKASSKKKGRGSGSSGRRQSSAVCVYRRVEQSDSGEDSDTDVEPDLYRKPHASNGSNRSSGKKRQSEACSSPMLALSATTLNRPAPSTATEAAIGWHTMDTIIEVRPPTVAGVAASRPPVHASTETAATLTPKEETSGGAAAVPSAALPASVRPLKVDPDLMEAIKCLEPEAFERLLRLRDEQSKLVWRTLDQMRSGTFNANTQAMIDFLLTNKVPAHIDSIMKDPSRIEVTLECAAWALGG